MASINFEQNHLELISHYEDCLIRLERMVFTKKYNLSSDDFALIAIQSISIIYSYWEGFIQRSFSLYIDYINAQNNDYKNYDNAIKIKDFEFKHKQLHNYPSKTSGKVKFYDQLESFFSVSSHDLDPVVNTESNVNFKVLNNLLIDHSLKPFEEFWGVYKHPNPSLKETLDTFIRYRNSVSHGGDTSSEEKVTQDVYNRYKQLVIDLMYEMHSKFMEGINSNSYLKH